MTGFFSRTSSPFTRSESSPSGSSRDAIGARECQPDLLRVAPRRHHEVELEMPLVAVIDDVDAGIDAAGRDPPEGGVAAERSPRRGRRVVHLARHRVEPRDRRRGPRAAQRHAQGAGVRPDRASAASARPPPRSRSGRSPDRVPRTSRVRGRPTSVSNWSGRRGARGAATGAAVPAPGRVDPSRSPAAAPAPGGHSATTHAIASASRILRLPAPMMPSTPLDTRRKACAYEKVKVTVSLMI